MRPYEGDGLYEMHRETALLAYQPIFPPGLYPFPDDAERKTWHDLVAGHERSHQLLVADTGGEMVGAVVAKPGTLQRLFVLPGHCGTGVAGRLLAAAMDVSCKARAQPCQLEVLEANWRARQFYERHGWVRDHRSRAADHAPYPVVVGYTLHPAAPW